MSSSFSGSQQAFVQGDDTGQLVMPTLPSSQELYDAIMVDIEPELTSQQLPTLLEKYKDETSDRKKTRKKRYDAAFKEYRKRYAAFSSESKQLLRSFQKQATALEERGQRTEEENTLSHISDSLQNL